MGLVGFIAYLTVPLMRFPRKFTAYGKSAGLRIPTPYPPGVYTRNVDSTPVPAVIATQPGNNRQPHSTSCEISRIYNFSMFFMPKMNIFYVMNGPNTC